MWDRSRSLYNHYHVQDRRRRRRQRYRTLRNQESENRGTVAESSEGSSQPDQHTPDVPTTNHVQSNSQSLAQLNEVQVDKLCQEIRLLYRPVEMQRSAIANSLLMFKVALGLTREATIDACFNLLRLLMTRTSSIELLCAADGPHKLLIAEDAWSKMDDNQQSAVKHFNSMLSSCHRFLGAKELKAVDIQLKLEELQLLAMTDEKFQESQQIRRIPAIIDRFAREVESLLHSISRAGKQLEHHVDIPINENTNGISDQNNEPV